MLPSRTAVDNLIKVVLRAQDHRSAQQILLDMAHYYFRQWQQAQQADSAQQLLTVLQVFCELGLGWQKEFDQLLAAMQLQQLRNHFYSRLIFLQWYRNQRVIPYRAITLAQLSAEPVTTHQKRIGCSTAQYLSDSTQQTAALYLFQFPI